MWISKILPMLLGGVIFFLGQFNMAEGSPCEVPEGQNALQAEQKARQGSHMVYGEVLRTDGGNYVIKQKGGKEVRVQADQKTEKPEIKKGDHISANVDNQNHALWIRSNESTDRRSEHASADCNPNEEPSDRPMNKSKGK